MKKLLLIAYDFPPAGNVGIYRSLKFAKYLSEFGWQPVVLTVSNGKYARYDPQAMNLIPDGITVERASSFEWFNGGESARKHGQSPSRSLWTRIGNRLRRTWAYFMLPDDKVMWVPAATIKAFRLIREHGIRNVYITGSPFSSFLIGWLLKKVSPVNLAIDYRDPWTQNLNYLRRSRLHTAVERWQERRCVNASDVVIANTRINEEAMVREFGVGQPREKFITIHNGFDSSDFAGVDGKKYDKFTVTYAGAFYFSPGSSWKDSAGDDVMRTYSPIVFFQALRLLLQREPSLRGRMQANFMGVLADGYDPMIEEYGLSDVVKRLGFLDYDEHLRVLKGSDLMLLVLSSGEKSRGWIPSKFFSYLGSGNPVLALAPEGEVRDIIRATNGGAFVEPDDVEGTAEALLSFYELYRNDSKYQRREDEVRNFDRRYLTKKLATTLQ